MYKVTGHFFAPCRRNKETKQTSGLPRLFLCFCMEPRSSEQPPALPAGGREAAEGQAVKRKNGFLSDRGGLRCRRNAPRPRQRSLPCARAVCPNRRRRTSTLPIRSRCGSKNTGSCFRFVSSCSRVQRPGVHRRHRRWQGARPTRYRTDRGRSKKRQVSGRTAKR